MLDFTRLKAPAEHGEVLVDPKPSELVAAGRENRARLDASAAEIAGLALREWRTQTRARTIGSGPELVIVTGHQPEFMHAGVWAKQVVAARLAEAVGGAAVNLVVDNDAPESTDLLIPVNGPSVELRRIPSTSARTGVAYECLSPLTAEETRRFERQVREAMGSRFERSMMPLYLQGLRRAPDPANWVDQTLAARHAVEIGLGIRVHDVRVSAAWWSPLLAEFLINVRRFAETYNAALADYRREHKVRGASRPVPDLVISTQRVEIPVWGFRCDEPRRRVFVEENAHRIRVFAGDAQVSELGRDAICTQSDLVRVIQDRSGWRLRPRALTLTLWARLLLADLFIHGIGGAKYDRITDRIIKNYFGLEPPAMACVTSTMRLGGQNPEPHVGVSIDELRRKRETVRRIMWNPHLNGRLSADLAGLREQRRELARMSTALRERSPEDHQARRDVFRRLRALNDQLVTGRQRDLDEARAALEHAERLLLEAKVANSREYFFALLERSELERLLAALPGQRDFAV